MDVYEIINSRIKELLEQGTVPWRKTWSAGEMPRNLVSKRGYRGVNLFLLACQPYSSSYWLTFKQCESLGGHVKRGSKSMPVIFWKMLDRNTDDTETTTTGKIPLLRYYSVFNTDQCEGITIPPTQKSVNPFSPIERAEQIITNMLLRPEIKHGGNQPCYSPTLDYVRIPQQTAFDTPEDYYDTLFHELSHSTGHVSRLARKGIMETSYYGTHEYSKEELVAEMSAAFLCGHVGIVQNTIENNAAYIRGFLKLLKGDKTAIVHAAAAAQKSADYILNIKPEDHEETCQSFQ
jgi:antirestriction protein ArdC